MKLSLASPIALVHTFLLSIDIHVASAQTTPTLNSSIGTDGPQPPATVGWVQNHIALQVNDLDASLEFYTKILGFRTISIAGFDWFKIAYIGYPAGGKNGTGFQTGEEMLREAANREGLIELIWSESAETITPVGSGFSHIGIAVKDTQQFYNVAEDAAAELGVQLEWYLKPTESIGIKGMKVLGINGFEEVPEWLGAVYPPGWAMLADPDGYVVEVLASGA